MPWRNYAVATATGWCGAVAASSRTNIPNCIWGDSMGELMLFYAAADIAFVGGSFSGTGGHNPLEPAALGLAGGDGTGLFQLPEHYRCAEGSGWAGAGLPIAAGLQAQLSIWLEGVDRRREAGQQAAAFVAANRGALDRLEQAVSRLLSPGLKGSDPLNREGHCCRGCPRFTPPKQIRLH